MKLKRFQREDLARSALHDGLIYGWDTGLGKTLAMYVWPLLKVGLQQELIVGRVDSLGVPTINSQLPNHRLPLCPAAPVLFIASGDLHEQIIAEGCKHFGVTPILLDSQASFLRLSTVGPTGRRVLPPGYYLTTYTQLSRNGVVPFPELNLADPAHMLRLLNLSAADVQEFFAGRAERYRKHYQRLGTTPGDTVAGIAAHWERQRACANSYTQADLAEAHALLQHFAPVERPGTLDFRLWPLDCLRPESQAFVTARFVATAHKSLSHNLGESRWLSTINSPSINSPSIKCLYSPTLADLCADTFACVVADEGVKLKGEDTLVGKGVRQMSPRYRLILTATPIKNRLPDLFRLAHWSTGAHRLANPRFPFGDDDAELFAEQFLVTERNLSAEERSETNKRYIKCTPQVCSIHRLWKLFAPIILRRRKTDCGEELVKMNRHVVRVPMGTAQAGVYKYHLDAKYKDKNGRPALGAQLQALRIAAANPTSTLLDPVPGSPVPPTSGPTPYRSGQSYVPKLASALSLVHQVLERREQVIIFSAFHDSLDALSARLRESGVPPCGSRRPDLPSPAWRGGSPV